MLSSKQNSPRSYRIVGPQRQLDERETPHPRVDRGEFGARLRDWRKNRAGSDPSGGCSAAAAKAILITRCSRS